MLLQLNSPELQSDPRNPSVPILDHFPSTDDDTILLVMPYLYTFCVPDFSFTDEVIDFFRQTLEVSYIVTSLSSLMYAGLEFPPRKLLCAQVPSFYTLLSHPLI